MTGAAAAAAAADDRAADGDAEYQRVLRRRARETQAQACMHKPQARHRAWASQLIRYIKEGTRDRSLTTDRDRHDPTTYPLVLIPLFSVLFSEKV